MIASPINSFVDFNSPTLACSGDLTAVSLPAFDHFGIKFQFKVVGELLPTSTVFKAAVCSDECDILHNPDYEVIPICNRYVFGVDGLPLTDEVFPVTVGNYAPAIGQPQIPEGVYTRLALIEVIEQYYEYALPSLDYYSCCEAPTITGIVIFYNGGGPAHSLNLYEYYGYGYVNFPADPMTGIIVPNQCFKYCILDEADEVQVCSNLFYRITDDCLTTVFNYYNEENAFDFKYVTYDDNGITRITENQIRLWLTFDRPRHLVEEEVFRRSDKVQQRLSTLIEKEWACNSSYMSILQHDKLIALLKHDILNVYNRERSLNRRMTQLGAPEPAFPEVRDYPTYPVTFNMRDYVSSYVNNNCGFNCGVELVDTCTDGGVTPPCPEKFKVEFEMANEQATYQNDNLIGKNELGIEVYREGLLQYTIGVNNYSLDSITGIVTFVPVGYFQERIAIIEV